jgi:TP901 family phage tail tape measure protein
MPDDIFALGFSIDNKQAAAGIVELANSLLALEGNYNKVKNLFEHGFDLRTDGSVNQFSQLVKNISESSSGVRDLSGAFKSIAGVLPKLSAEKVMPINEDSVNKMTEFSLAGTAASNSLKQFVDGEFIRRVQEGRKELGAFNAALLQISQNAREAKTHLTAIPGMLNKLRGDNIKPVSKESLERLNKLAAVGEKAGSVIVNLIPHDLPILTENTAAKFLILATNIKIATENSKEAKKAFDGLKSVLPKISAKTIQPVTEQTIQSMRDYAAAVNAAAQEVSHIRNSVTGINLSKRSLSDFGTETVKVGSRAKSLGSELLSIATTTSLPMFFRNAAKEAVNFGAELAQIESLTLNFSADKLRQGLLALPSAFGDARKNANALYYAYSSGVEGTEEDLIKFTGQISKLSQVIRANQTDTVSAVTSAFNAYNLSVKDAAEVSDLFYAIVKRGRAEGNELATGLGQVIPTAATAGLSLNEMGASITSLTKVMNTRNAITYFNNALSKLIKPTKESRLEAKKLGIELGLDALRAKGFSAMMEELRQKTLGNQEALLRIFPDLRGQRAALQLLNKGWGDFQSQLAFFEKKAGVADQAFEKLNESIEYQLSILPQTFGKIKIAAGEVMTGVLTLGGALEPVLRAFNNMGVTGQRIVGTFALIAAGYGLLRAKSFLMTSVQSVEIRHQQVLSALRQKEVAERGAVTVAVNSENVAKQRAGSLAVMLNNFGKSQVGTEYALAQARYASAIASGRVAAITKAQLALDKTREIFVKKENMSFIQKNKLLLLENQLLTQNTALKLANMKAGAGASVFGAKGFSGGFKGAGGFDALTAMFTLNGVTSAKRALVMFRRGLFSFGKVLAGTLGVVSKIFNPLTILLAGAVGFIDILYSKGDSYKEKVGNSTIGKIGNAIYDFFTGAITEAEHLSKFLDDKRDAKLYAKNLRDIAKGISAPFVIAADNVDSFKTQFETLNQNTKRAFDALNSAKMSDMIREYNKVTEQIKSFGDIEVPNWTKIIKEANQKFGTDFKFDDVNTPSKRALLLGQAGQTASNTTGKLKEHAIKELDALNYIDKAVRKFGESSKKLDLAKLKEKAEELSGKITPALDAHRRAGESLVTFWSRQKALILGIKGLIEQQRFAMMKPAEQMKKQAEYIENYKKEYEHSLRENNGESASRAMKNILSTYSSMLKKLDNSIKDLKRFSETLGKDSFDALLKSFDTPAKKIKALNKRAETLFGESGVLWSGGKFSIPSLDNEKLKSSYAKAKSAIELQIMAVQDDINSKKSLAEAEKQANAKTVELIRSFSKFSATATEAVDAFSIDAIKLQSRRFSAVPKFEQRETAQAGLQGAQTKLSELYAKMSQLAESFKQVADSRRQQTESQRGSLASEFENYMNTVMESSQKAADKQVEAINKLIQDAKKIEEKFGRVEEHSKRTADNTGKTAKVVGNLSTVMIG